MTDDEYVNPLLYTTLGAFSRSGQFPDESQVMSLYDSLKSFSPEDIISLAVTDPSFSSYVDIIRDSISGMSYRSVGRVITQLLDKNFPALMQSINTNEAEFDLYRAVVIGLVDKIRKDEINADA